MADSPEGPKTQQKTQAEGGIALRFAIAALGHDEVLYRVLGYIDLIRGAVPAQRRRPPRDRSHLRLVWSTNACQRFAQEVDHG